MLKAIQNSLERNGGWIDQEIEIADLIKSIEKELSKGLKSQKDEKLKKLLSKALWLIGTILGYID